MPPETLAQRIARFERFRDENREHYEALQELAREYAEAGDTESEQTVRAVMAGYAISVREYDRVIERLRSRQDS